MMMAELRRTSLDMDTTLFTYPTYQPTSKHNQQL